MDGREATWAIRTLPGRSATPIPEAMYTILLKQPPPMNCAEVFGPDALRDLHCKLRGIAPYIEVSQRS